MSKDTFAKVLPVMKIQYTAEQLADKLSRALKIKMARLPIGKRIAILKDINRALEESHKQMRGKSSQ